MSGKRNIFIVALALLGGVDLIMASVPFVSSLGPSKKAKSEMVAWSTPPEPNLEPGQVLVRQVTESARRDNLNGGWSPIWGKRDLLIRDHEGVYYSFRVPTWKGKVVLPRILWGQWEGECVNFGPQTTDGMLEARVTIQCNDPDYKSWFENEPKWSLVGDSLVEPYPDLPKLRCRDEGKDELTCY